jgi:hypothetical protein
MKAPVPPWLKPKTEQEALDELNAKILKAFKRRSDDHDRVTSALLEQGTPMVFKDLIRVDVKALSKVAKCSAKKTGEIVVDLRSALVNKVVTSKKPYVPEYSTAEFNEIFEKFCSISDTHRLVAETVKNDPDASTRDRGIANKSKLCEITGVSQKDIDAILEEMREAFVEF